MVFDVDGGTKWGTVNFGPVFQHIIAANSTSAKES